MFVKATQAKCISDTVVFMHKHITQRAITAGYVISKVAHGLISALKGKHNDIGEQQQHGIQRLAWQALAHLGEEDLETRRALAGTLERGRMFRGWRWEHPLYVWTPLAWPSTSLPWLDPDD